MGTTLTGTTPQDTYESLIKVTDNGPLSATAKFLSDGEGTDSVLALSTSRLGVGKIPDTYRFDLDSADGNIARFSFLGANATFDISAPTTNTIRIGAASGDVLGLVAGGTEAMRILTNGNVGIGTSAPTAKLEVSGNVNVVSGSVNFGATGSAASTDPAIYRTGTSNGLAVTIGSIERARFTTDGLTFNGDTAAANALDDYEEGTWTIGISFGGASVGVTTSTNTGTYTKIGRQVTVVGGLGLTSKGSSAGTAEITGLPFTIGATAANHSPASFWLNNVTFANQYQCRGLTSDTKIRMEEITEGGTLTNIDNTNFANNSEVFVNLTYFV